MTNTVLTRKRLLIAAAVLAAVLVAALVSLFVTVMTVDVSRYRGEIEALLSRGLEREVRIGGAITLERSLRPRLVIEEVSIANPPTTSRPNFASAKRLEIKIALLPLLSRRLRIVELMLVGGEALFEKAADGTPNWQLGPKADTAGGPGVAVEVVSLRVESSKLGYRAPDGDRTEGEINRLDARLVPDEPVRVDLTGRFHSLPVEAKLDGDTLEALFAAERTWKFRGKLVAGSLHADVSGSLRDPLKLAGVEVSLRYFGTRSGDTRSALTEHVPRFAEYRGVARFTSDSAGFGFDLDVEGSGAELSKLWAGRDEVSALAINAKQLRLQGRGTAGTLSELLVRASWQLSAEGAELRWQHLEGKTPIVFDRATVEAAAKPGGPIGIVVKGRYRDEEISARGTLGKIEALLSPKAPWPIDALVETTKAGGEFRGTMLKPLSEALFEGHFTIRAEQLSSVGEVVGVELPPRGPAALTGKLAEEPGRTRLSDLEFTLGGSRLRGNVIWSAKDSPALRVALAPSQIRFEELRKDANFEAQQNAAPESIRGTKQTATKRGRMIPQILLTGKWIREADVDLSLDDLKFTDANKVLASFDGKLRVAKGRFDLSNLRSEVSGMLTVASMTIDATRDPTVVEARLDAPSIDYGALLKASGVTDGVKGVLAAQVRLAGEGNDLYALLQQAKGRVEILGDKGYLRGKLLEIWGGNLMQILNPVSWARNSDTELNCVAGRFNIGDGVVRSELLLLDSRDVTVAGEMVLNLATEEINGLFKPQPKQASLLKLATPMRLSGTLGAPSVGPTEHSLLTLGKIAIGVAQPYALILMFGDLGAKEKNPCAALLAKPLAGAAQPAPPAK
jgi:uncharacterized protein involved in outer membrane biogenesis